MANYKLNYTGEQVNEAIGKALNNIKGHTITFGTNYTNFNFVKFVYLDNQLLPHSVTINVEDLSNTRLENVYKILRLYARSSTEDPNYIYTNVENAITTDVIPDFIYVGTTNGETGISTLTKEYSYVLKDCEISFNYLSPGVGN